MDSGRTTSATNAWPLNKSKASDSDWSGLKPSSWTPCNCWRSLNDHSCTHSCWNRSPKKCQRPFLDPTDTVLAYRDGSRILVWEGDWQEVWWTEFPQRCPGAEPRCGLEAKPREARRLCYVMRLKNHLRREKNKSIQTDVVDLWQYHNYHHLIHSSFYVSSHFCLKIQNAVCGLQSQRNGPQWQPGLIKWVSWNEHYRNVRNL